jgi:hypothetical protein
MFKMRRLIPKLNQRDPGVLYYHPPPRPLVLYLVVVSFFAAYVACHALPVGAGYAKRLTDSPK